MGQRLNKIPSRETAQNQGENTNPSNSNQTHSDQGSVRSSSTPVKLIPAKVERTEESFGDRTRTLSLTEGQSLESSSPNQVIIRIQLTKMENNNNSTENLDDMASGIYDNNLNITCSAHSIINVTVSNNIACDAPNSLSNNLNDRNCNQEKPSNIHSLNIVEDHSPVETASLENNLNQPENRVERRQTNNSVPGNDNRTSHSVSSSNASFRANILPNNSSNMSMVAADQPAASTTCCAANANGTSCNCNEHVEHNCNSGHNSLCAESNREGDRRHCCRTPKKFSRAYPSALRCCRCAGRESPNISVINNQPSTSRHVEARGNHYRNSFVPNVSRPNNTAAVSSIRPADTPPPPHQILVLSVGPDFLCHPQALAPGFPQEIGWFLSTGSVLGVGSVAGPMVHSQADYSHCLVPDLERIINCSFYWGKMDRYEAERLLEGKPEGTFLLRDSAQEEYLFSVTFRKYGRSLHARIEQMGHKFSFDCHDPGVFTASTVTGLLEHYKDPSCVMFFEPMLTIPLHRNFSFSLQQLCRATIVSHIKYDGINELQLPSSLKAYLKEYHYKYKVRETPLDESLYQRS